MINIRTGEKIFKNIGLLALVFLSMVGCERTTNLNSDPAYKEFIGKEYRSKIPLVVLRLDDSKKNYLLYRPGQDGLPKSEELKKISFPYRQEDYSRTLYGVLPEQTLFEVSKINFVKSIEWSMTDYYLIVKSSGPFYGQIVVGDMITDMKRPVTKLDPKYVEEVRS